MKDRLAVDKLTGVLTRDALAEIETAFGARRAGEPWSVLMVDVDDFKMINDVHGHLAGDRVLQQIAWLLVRGVRDVDEVIRFGGDEFLVVLPATGALQAANVARRFLDGVGAEAFPSGMRVRASVGLAESDPSDGTLSSVVGKADQALYDSKAGGKSRMSFFSPARAGDRGLSFEHFIDRQVELKRLRSCYDESMGGKGTAALVTGEPGVGKSRLVEELRHYCSFRGGGFAHVECDELGSSVPFGTIAEAVCAVIETLPLERRREMADSTGPVLREASLLFPSLPLVVSEEPDPPDWARGRLFYRQFAKILSGLSAETPLVLFVDDIQWGHSQDLDLIGYLVRGSGDSKLMFVFAMRSPVEMSSEVWNWMKGLLTMSSRFERIDLQPLGEEHISSMVLLALGDPHVPAWLVRRLAEGSGGNPLYVRELLKSLEQTGAIRTDGQGRRSYGAESDFSLPRGTALLVKSRLEPLGEEARDALRMGSLLNGGFGLQDLAFLLERTPVEAAKALEQPLSMELIHESPEGDSGGDFLFRFTHDCVRASLLDEIPAALRRHQYTRLARRFEEQFRAGRTEVLQLAAFCHCEGLDREKALEFASLAAEESGRRQATYDQAGWLERFVAIAESTGKASAQNLLDAWRTLGRLYILHARPAKAEVALEKASSYALTSADLGTVSVLRASLHAERFEYESALEEYERALGTDMPMEQLLQARIRTAFIWHRQGSTEMARGMLDQVRDQLDGIEDSLERSRLEASFLSTYGTLLAQSGDSEHGLAMCREALDFYESAGDQINKARAQRFLSGILAAFPAWEERLRLLRAAISTFTETGDAQSLMAAYLDLGNVHLELNEPDVSDEWFLKCLDLSEASGSGARAAASELCLAESSMQRDDSEGALGHFERSAAGGKATGFLQVVGSALAGQARALSALGRVREAEVVVSEIESTPEFSGSGLGDPTPFLFARGMVSYHGSVPGEKEPLEQALVHFHGARKLASSRNLVDSLELIWHEALCLRELNKSEELAAVLDEASALVDLSLTAIESPIFRADFSRHRFVEGIRGMKSQVG